MKNKLIIEQSLKQTLHMTSSMRNQIKMLSMDREKLAYFLSEVAQSNPFLEYTPSQDISNFISETIADQPSLQSELYYQLHTCDSDYDERITEYIIESLDEHGFFSMNIKEACDDLKINIETLEYNLTLIQTFEPIGVAAKNSVNSLCIQLRYQNNEIGAKILENFQTEIMNQDFTKIAQVLEIELSEVLEVMQEIRNCNPYPCSNYSTKKVDYALPEFEVKIDDGELVIEPKEMGSLCLQTNGLEKEKDKKIKEYFKQAKFYIDSVNKRNKTMLILANALFTLQKGYFLYDDELHTCTLKQISEETGFSISTVSRTLSQKYYTFQDQLYPIKSLFVSSTREGSSKDSILKAIKYFVENEDKEAPYMDEALVEKLENMELFVSRRTISKYRKLLNIPNSKNRKKFYKVR